MRNMKNRDEEIELYKRRCKAYFINWFYRMLWFFPVKKGKIVFTTFEGDGGFCCNPRYIAEEIIHRRNDKKKYRMVWLINNMERQFPREIRKVKNTFWNRAYHLATAQVWVDNSRKAYGTAKRKSQLYIQTWHGALEFKPVGKYRGKLFPKIAYLVSKYDSKLVDYVISNSEWCTKHYPKMLLYNGNVIKSGSPRCDIFITRRAELYKMIRERYRIPENGKIVIYAPTFRGGGQKGKRRVYVDIPTLDFAGLRESLNKKFGGIWYVFMRLHPQLAAQMEEVPVKERKEYMIDVSQADDMNEMLVAADVLVTDYSSSAFDAANMYIPVFLYMDDLEEYTRERGELMWDLQKLPFPVAETNTQLKKRIEAFDGKIYKEEVRVFLERQGVLEDGHASERVVDVIERFIQA